MAVRQNGVVAPARKPQRRICIYKKCISSVLSRSLDYAPRLQVSLAFEVNLYIANKFED